MGDASDYHQNLDDAPPEHFGVYPEAQFAEVMGPINRHIQKLNSDIEKLQRQCGEYRTYVHKLKLESDGEISLLNDRLGRMQEELTAATDEALGNGPPLEMQIWEEFTHGCLRTWSGVGDTDKDQVGQAAMGISDEAGEVLGLVKKYLYHEHDRAEEKMKDELGDVFYYMAVMMVRYQFTLREVLTRNRDKLQARYPEKFDSERSVNRVALGVD